MPHSIFSPTHGTRRHRQPHPEQAEQEPFFSKTVKGGEVESAPAHFFNRVQTKPVEEKEQDRIQEKSESGGNGEHIQRAPVAEAPPPPAAPGGLPSGDPAQTAAPVQDAAAAPETNGRFIVEDGQTPGPDQMRKTDFLQRLKDETCQTANQALAGTPFNADSCPYIRNAFARQRNSSPVQIERLLTRYEPLLQTAQSLEAYFQIFKVKVNSVVSNWVSTGDISGVPEDIAAQIPECVRLAARAARGLESTVSTIASGIGSVVSGIGSAVSSIGSLFFKAKPGGAHATRSPLAVMQSLGKGSPMEGGTRSKMEGAFGTSFSNVEVHTDSKAASLSDGMNAKAFTVGNHVAFGSGEHRPGTLEGDALMAHELAHVEQQRGAKEMTFGPQHDRDLESDANMRSLEAVHVDTGKKSITRKSKLSISRCNKGSSSSSSSSSSTPATPATTIPPEFEVTGLPEDTGSARNRNKVFFNRNISGTVEPSEYSKLTLIASTHGTTPVDLHGYKSEDESTANLENDRIAKVTGILSTEGHTAAKNPLPHPGAGSGNIDYRHTRVVEIKQAGGVPSTPQCIDPATGAQRDGIIPCSPASQFTTAQTKAKQILTRVIGKLSPSGLNATTKAALTRFFGATSASMTSVAATVRENLSLLKPHIVTQMNPVSPPVASPGATPAPGHRCADGCDSTCSGGTIAYNSMRDANAVMTLCEPFMQDTDVVSRAETLIHEGLHGITLHGVTASGGGATNAKDFTYEWQRLINFLDTDTALKNNDSYVLFIRQIMNPGTPVQAGQAVGEQDILHGITPGSAEDQDVKASVAWLESWLEKADQDVSGVYGTITESVGHSWTNSYYEGVMSLLAPRFGLTVPPLTPTGTDQFRVAGISDRFSKLRNTVVQQLTITRSTTGLTSWSSGPGTTLTVGTDFFALSTRRAKLDLLIRKLVDAHPGIVSTHKSHYVALVDEIRIHAGRSSP